MSYTVKFAPTGNEALDAALAGSSQLAGLRKTAPAGPFALVSRAKQDSARLMTALQSFGYYAATVGITVDGKSLDDPSLPDALQALPASQSANIDVAVKTGPLFHLGAVTLNGEVPASAEKSVKLKPGDPAVASTVLAAGDALLGALQEQGYALAKVDSPVAILHPAADTLDVRFKVVTGPRVDIGPIRFTGLQRMHETFLRRRLLLVHQGELYQPSKIEAARQALASVGVFSSVQVQAKPALDARGEIPLTFAMQERKLHAVSLNASYSTDLGASAGVTWSHRDLFGNAEQLNLSASLTGAGGTADQGLGYDAKIQFLKPDYYRRDQTLELDVEGLKQNLISYDQTAITAGPILTRKLSKSWSVSAGLKATQERIIQQDVTRDYTLLALPLTARYDGTGVANPLDDPTHGMRVTISATPTESFTSPASTFASQCLNLCRLFQPGHEQAWPHRAGPARPRRQCARGERIRPPARPAFLRRRLGHGARLQIPVRRPAIRRRQSRRRHRHRCRHHRIAPARMGTRRRCGVRRRSAGQHAIRTVRRPAGGGRGRGRAILHADRAGASRCRRSGQAAVGWGFV